MSFVDIPALGGEMIYEKDVFDLARALYTAGATVRIFPVYGDRSLNLMARTDEGGLIEFVFRQPDTFGHAVLGDGYQRTRDLKKAIAALKIHEEN